MRNLNVKEVEKDSRKGNRIKMIMKTLSSNWKSLFSLKGEIQDVTKKRRKLLRKQKNCL